MIKEKAKIYISAIESIQVCTRIYHVKFDMYFKSYHFKESKEIDRGLWVISVMSKKFRDENFIVAVGIAIQFVYTAHDKHQ